MPVHHAKEFLKLGEKCGPDDEKKDFGGCGVYTPTPTHMNAPRTQKLVFPYYFIMIEAHNTKKLGVRFFSETFVIILWSNDC